MDDPTNNEMSDDIALEISRLAVSLGVEAGGEAEGSSDDAGGLALLGVSLAELGAALELSGSGGGGMSTTSDKRSAAYVGVSA